MERLRDRRTGGLSGSGLRLWGLVFLAAGMVGRSVLQNQLLGVGTISTQQLLEIMNASDEAMIIATVALLLQVVETCAVPVFTFLLLEGFQHTSNFMKYFLRVLGVAVVSELPYNFAMTGGFVDASSRNPVFAMVLGLVLLYFYKRYEGRSAQNVLVKVMVAAATLVWSVMLRVDSGVCIVVVVCVLWLFRRNPLYRNMAGATAAVVCSLTSPLLLAAPMGFLLVHFYNETHGGGKKVINYLAYPVLLLAIGFVGKFILY